MAVEIECSVCGYNGQPPAGCETCHGNALVQERQYTLSEHRSGKAPAEDRYGEDGGLNPQPSPLVVGGHVNHPGHGSPRKQTRSQG